MGGGVGREGGVGRVAWEVGERGRGVGGRGGKRGVGRTGKNRGGGRGAGEWGGRE